MTRHLSTPMIPTVARHIAAVSLVRRSLAILCTAACALGSAQALEEIAALDPLPPMPRDERSVGWEWHFIDQNGEPGHMRLTATDGISDTYQRTDGCVWTRPLQGFAPAQRWSGCPSSGTASVTLDDSAIWPLEVGKTFVWTMSGRSNLLKAPWRGYRRCEVLPSVRVKIVSGVFDTHKVHCEERWGTRTWWLAPEVGTAVAYRQKTRRGTVLQEMTRLQP